MFINVILAFMIIGSFLLAIALHESGHTLMATLLGDSTPRSEGRQSLSLRTHLDSLGTVLCLILAFYPALAGPVGLGWGKPVKTDAWKLRGGPNAGTLLVALAGPLLNVLVGLLFAVLLRLLPASLFNNDIAIRLPQLLTVFASVNISIAIFNILPFYPLDGYQIVYTLLPTRQAVQFAKSLPYGPLIVLALFFLLPFLAQFSGSLGGFFLFHIPLYVLMGSIYLISLVTGLPFGDVFNLYLYRLVL